MVANPNNLGEHLRRGTPGVALRGRSSTGTFVYARRGVPLYALVMVGDQGLPLVATAIMRHMGSAILPMSRAVRTMVCNQSSISSSSPITRGLTTWLADSASVVAIMPISRDLYTALRAGGQAHATVLRIVALASTDVALARSNGIVRVSRVLLAHIHSTGSGRAIVTLIGLTTIGTATLVLAARGSVAVNVMVIGTSTLVVLPVVDEP